MRMRLSAGHLIERYMHTEGLGAESVDGIVAGSPDTSVTGVAVTFLASQPVLERAAALGANFLITHEGLYYSHRADGIERTSSVALAKKAWIEASGMVVYRYHDGIHRSLPDQITAGLIEALGWEPYVEKARPEASVVRLPAAVGLRALAAALKEKLALPYVRVVGDLNADCARAGVAVGYRGGGAVAIPLFEDEKVDVVIAGEGPEWETPEYVRDAVHHGKRKAFVLLGHAASEEPGMERLARRLRAAGLGVPVHVVSDRPALEIV